MNYAPLVTLALLVSATLLPAQTVMTLPKGMATREGNLRHWVPMRHTPSRIMCGYSAQATGWSGKQTINSLTPRADSLGQLPSAITVDMQVVLSSSGARVRVESPKPMYNHGNDQVVFMKRKKVSIKAFGRRTPQPFSIVLKGDKPFVADKQLVIDWTVYTPGYRVFSGFYMDGVRAAAMGREGSSIPFGFACNPRTFWNYMWGYNVGELLRGYAYTRNKGDAVIMWLSPKRLLQSIGGGCSVYADPFHLGTIVFPSPQVSGDPDGYVSFEFGFVPAAIRGATFWSQCLALTPGGGRRWSRGQQTRIGNRVPALDMGYRYNYSLSSRLFDPDKDPLIWGETGYALIFKVN